jgi:UDPglucose--hexose-1-phosphate uridylyltransferase
MKSKDVKFVAEIRYNPLLKDWVMIASHRQDRPQMPKDWCPFCPGSGKVPENYDVLKYNNDFPALSETPPPPDDVASDFFKLREAYGKCEVILYSPEHNATLPELSVEHITKLVHLWCERTEALRKDHKNKYIFIFENRGEVVGVTMPHPHGQIYAYPYIPKKLELEVESSKEHYNHTKNCLICDIMKEEVKLQKRVIFENDDFVVVLPFFSEYPYGLNVYAKRHVCYITEFNATEKKSLADCLKKCVGTLDSLFDKPFPYMMCIHQAPVNSDDYRQYFHFHIEFYPPMRSAEKQKFNASSETGAWAPCNPTAPEEKAIELRKAYQKFRQINIS